MFDFSFTFLWILFHIIWLPEWSNSICFGVFIMKSPNLFQGLCCHLEFLHFTLKVWCKWTWLCRWARVSLILHPFVYFYPGWYFFECWLPRLHVRFIFDTDKNVLDHQWSCLGYFGGKLWDLSSLLVMDTYGKDLDECVLIIF